MHLGWFIRFTSQLEAAAVGRVQACDDVEECGFASAVGTNQAIDLTAFNGACATSVKACKPPKRLEMPRDIQHEVCSFDFKRHVRPPLWVWSVLAMFSAMGHKPRGRHKHDGDHGQSNQQLAQNGCV